MNPIKKSSNCFLLGATFLLAGVLQIQANPLVYPNRFSFQKTTPSTTEATVLNNHDLLNNNSIASSESKTKSGFPFDILGWTVGATLLVCVLAFLYYSRKKRGHEGSDRFAPSQSYLVGTPEGKGSEMDQTKMVPG